MAVFLVVTMILVTQTAASLREGLFAQSKTFGALATTPIGNAYVLYQDSGRAKIGEQVHALSSLNDKILSTTIVDTSGSVVYSYPDDSADGVSAQQAGSYEPVYIRDAQGTILRVVYPFIESSGLHRYSVIYDISSSFVDASVRQTIWWLVALGSGGIALSALLMFMFVDRALLLPFRRLSLAALEVSTGNLDQQIASARQDEIGDLAGAVNTMANSLKADIEKLRVTDEFKSEFLRLASHHLRTPLTVIRGYVDMMKSERSLSAAETAEYMRAIASATDRLSLLVEDMLIIASLEVGDAGGPVEAVSIPKVVNAQVKIFQELAQRKQVKLKLKLPSGPIWVAGNDKHIGRAIAKVLDNAVEFTRPGDSITVTVATSSHQVQVTIRDTGSGMAPDELAKLFTKFHRGTDSLIFDHDGVGLGLYVAKSIVTHGGGSISVSSEPRSFTEVVISLPISTSSQNNLS